MGRVEEGSPRRVGALQRKQERPRDWAVEKLIWDRYVKWQEVI